MIYRLGNMSTKQTEPDLLPANRAKARRRTSSIFERTRQRLRAVPGGNKVSRLFTDDSARAALFVFVLSRTLVLTIFVVVGLLRISPDPDFPGYSDVVVSAHKITIARILRQEALTADANWYLGIAENGYEHHAFDADKAHNWAFFPLFPLLLRVASYVTREFVLTGVALSHFFFLLALFLMHRTCRLFGLTESDANRSIFYLAFFPVSYFFSLPLTESLFLMLTVSSFFFTKRERWWPAGVAGALASATRASGVLLLPVVFLMYWQARKTLRPFRADALAPLLVPTGLLCYMVYLRSITGNAFAFKDAMAAWGRKAGFFFTPLLDYLWQPSEIASHWNFRFLNFGAAACVLICGLVLLKRREFVLALFTLSSVLLALSSALLQSQARYAMVVFPAYMVLARAGRRERLDQSIRAIFLVLFALMTALFAAHFTIALS
jgi:hypothetical protein